MSNNTDLLFDALPDEWEQTTLGNVCRRGGGFIQTGPFGSQLHAGDYVPVGIPTVMPANIGNNQIITDNIARITQRDAERLSRHRLEVGDVVFGRRGDVGRRALVRPEQAGWLCGTGSLRIHFGQGIVDPLFASYYLGHPDVRDWIIRHAVGSTMPNLNTAIMSAVPFALPPLSEQRAIARILGSLDDKIELNRRMNRTLEALAAAIFKSWFVDFDLVVARAEGGQPFGMDAETAALFPDAFEESEVGAVPAGWRVGVVGDIARNVRRGVQPNQIDLSTPYIGLEHMPQRSIALTEWGQAADVVSGKAAFRKGDILFGKLRPYFHKVGVAPLDGVCSTDIVVVNAQRSEWFGLLLGHLSSVDFINFVNASSEGTRMPRTNWGEMARYQIVIPSPEIGSRFSELLNFLLAKMHAGIFESGTLAAFRDALLPKLLAGEIRVGCAEQAVESIL